MRDALDFRVAVVPIISANTEATYNFSAKISRIQIQARGANALKFSSIPFTALSGAYQTIKSGGVYSEISLNARPRYFFTGTAGDKVELLYWY